MQYYIVYLQYIKVIYCNRICFNKHLIMYDKEFNN